MSCLQLYLQHSRPDLFRTVSLGRPDEEEPMQILVDVESCASRFYGGSHRDWLCGGQWSQMVEKLRFLKERCDGDHVRLVFFFRGFQDRNDQDNWKIKQKRDNARCKEIFARLKDNCDAETTSWRMGELYVEPTGTKTFLRLALQSLYFPIVQSMYDYKTDLINYATCHKMDGILTNSIETTAGAGGSLRSFLMTDSWIKINMLQAKEFSWQRIVRALELEEFRLPTFLALLGSSMARREMANDSTWNYLADFEASQGRRSFKGPASSPATATVSRQLQIIPPMMQQPRFRLVSRALTLARNLTVDHLNPESVAFSAFHHLSITDMRLLSKELRQDRVLGLGKSTDERMRDSSNDSAAGNSNTWKSLQLFLGDKTDASLLRLAGGFPSTQFQKPPLSRDLIRDIASAHRKGAAAPSLYQLASSGLIWLESTLNERLSTGIPSPNLIFKRMRMNLYRFVLTDGTNDSSAAATVSSAEQKSYELTLAEMSVPQGDNEIQEADVTVSISLDNPPSGNTDSFGRTRSPPKSMEAIFQYAKKGSTSYSALCRQRAKWRCFRSIFDDCDEDEDCDIPRDVFSHCPFVPVLLRYLLSVSNNGRPFFTCQMMDATLSTLVSPIVAEPWLIRQLSPPQLCPEGVAFAALLMRGLEWVVVANDACGLPFIPHQLLPSKFFDGKIFQDKFAKAKSGLSLLELCDGQSDQAFLVEQMREVVLSGDASQILTTLCICYNHSFLKALFTFLGVM